MITTIRQLHTPRQPFLFCVWWVAVVAGSGEKDRTVAFVTDCFLARVSRVENDRLTVAEGDVTFCVFPTG